ncbi:cytochrome P450 [Lyophyllum atratum]|nr:cytochrome P450 [Lyophyllum atratum]
MPLGLLRRASELYAQSSFAFQLRFLGHDIPLISALLAVFVTSRVIKFLNGIRSVSGLPGYRVPFQPLAPPGALIPTSWWNPGLRAHWTWRKTMYNKFQNESFSVVPFIMGAPSIYSSNLDVIRQVVSGDQKTSWAKSEAASRVLIKWGQNLVGAWDMDMWRKHRRVMGPAFNNKLYEMVWAETVHTYRQMEAIEGWHGKDTIDIPVMQKHTTKLALLIIAKCGFGFSFEWSAPPIGPDGTMSIQEALRILADSYIVGLMAPDWVRYLPGFGHIRKAFDQFSTFMHREVEARTAEVRNEEESADERVDAFTMLVKANEQETGKLRLSDQEVIGNVFIMLFAGHETTANTLAATLSLLALHQDIQNEVLEQIISVVGHDRDPAYKDYDDLYKVLSAFYEGLRLFPAAHIMLREATEDTVLHLPNPVGQEGTTPLAIQKGTNIVLDMVGTHYNARYFEDPEEFRPSRWYGTSNESESFPAFSIGPRACIGRKFATTEAVVFLAMLLRDWRIEPGLGKGETVDGWRRKVFEKPMIGLTMAVADAPVRLVRR